MDRGIITPAMEIISQGKQFCVHGGIPPEKLRYYILYWDKVVLTDNNMFGAGLSEEAKTLEKANILTKSTAVMNVSGRFDGSALANIQFEGLAQIAAKLINKNPGQWAIHQSCDHLVVPNGMSSDLITADLALNQCLPVPKPDTPLDKVLDFKMRHNDELLALRSTLDELYLEITKSADIPRSKIVQIQRLEQAIKDLNQVAKQSWSERLLASRKISLDIKFKSLVQGAVAAGLVGSNFNNPLIGIIAGAAKTITSSMKFEVSISPQLRAPLGQQIDLSYLSSMNCEDIAK